MKKSFLQVMLYKRAADFGKPAFLCESQKNAYRGQNYILCQGMFYPIVEEINMLSNQRRRLAYMSRNASCMLTYFSLGKIMHNEVKIRHTLLLGGSL
ncbi:protein of unknown function [Paenibacillus alvei]|uniref:Uncharacterized protein n=1 Tax=Paenibacillus alvei TaxID=44250 RepID=A0A383R7S8_PAEAL|nr:protein of unknown function [Paenibacillus alvei]